MKLDDVEMKLTLAVPFINLLGINLETSFDVRSWATKMYKKHKLKIFPKNHFNHLIRTCPHSRTSPARLAMFRTRASGAYRACSMQPPLRSLAASPSLTPLRQRRTTVSAQEIPRVMRTPPFLQSCTTTPPRIVSMAAISGICAPLVSLSPIRRQNRQRDLR